MSTKKHPMTFRESVEAFESASPWLGPQHAPAVVALRAMAKELDVGAMTPALLGQFGLAYRALQKEQPSAVVVDPVDEIIRAGRGAAA